MTWLGTFRTVCLHVVVVGLACGIGGCAIRLDATTQDLIADVHGKSTVASGYARAIKTTGYATLEERNAAVPLYDSARGAIETMVARLESEFKQTPAGQVVDPSVNGRATDAVKALDVFIAYGQKVETRPRPSDVATVTLVITTAITLGEKLEKWWTESQERRRAEFVEFVGRARLPAWTEVKPVESGN